MTNDQFSDFKDLLIFTVEQSEHRLEQRLGKRIDNLATELRDFRQETRQNFKAVAEAIDRHNDEIDGLDTRVTKLETKLV